MRHTSTLSSSSNVSKVIFAHTIDDALVTSLCKRSSIESEQTKYNKNIRFRVHKFILHKQSWQIIFTLPNKHTNINHYSLLFKIMTLLYVTKMSPLNLPQKRKYNNSQQKKNTIDTKNTSIIYIFKYLKSVLVIELGIIFLAFHNGFLFPQHKSMYSLHSR